MGIDRIDFKLSKSPFFSLFSPFPKFIDHLSRDPTRGTLDAALASRGKRNTAALRKALARCGAVRRGAARRGECTYFLRARACALVRARAMQQKQCIARARAYSRDRACQLAFSDNFHPPRGPSLGPLLSTFLCSFPRALSLSRDPIAPCARVAEIEDENDREASRFRQESLAPWPAIIFSLANAGNGLSWDRVVLILRETRGLKSGV